MRFEKRARELMLICYQTLTLIRLRDLKISAAGSLWFVNEC